MTQHRCSFSPALLTALLVSFFRRLGQKNTDFLSIINDVENGAHLLYLKDTERCPSVHARSKGVLRKSDACSHASLRHIILFNLSEKQVSVHAVLLLLSLIFGTTLVYHLLCGESTHFLDDFEKSLDRVLQNLDDSYMMEAR